MSHYIPLKIDIVFKHLFTNDLVSLASLISSILFPICPTGLIQSQLKAGDSYFQITPVIQINLLDFALLPTGNIVSRYLLKEEKSNHVLTDLFQMVYVELSKFKVKTISELKTERDIWLYLLNNMETLTEENRMEILSKKPDLKNAFDVLDLYATDPDKRRELEERLRADKNYAYELAAK